MMVWSLSFFLGDTEVFLASWMFQVRRVFPECVAGERRRREEMMNAGLE
jgi:hypothetical protein